MKTLYLLFFSLAALAYPMILQASAESIPTLIYSEQMTRQGDLLNICYQIVDIYGKPVSEMGLVLSASDGSTTTNQSLATDSDGIVISSFDINAQKTMSLKISRLYGNYTHNTDYDTKIKIFDSGISSEPKTTQIKLAAKPSVKNTCIEKTQTRWDILEQDDTTTTYFDMNTWTVVKADKNKIIEVSQAGKQVKDAKLSLGSWKDNIDKVLLGNGLAPTANQGIVQKVTVSEALKKPVVAKTDSKKQETKKETVKKSSIKPVIIKIKRGQTIVEKITGSIPTGLYQRGQTAEVSILKPDGKTEVQKIPVSSKGKFEHPFNITDKTKKGKYEITIRYSGTEVKKAFYEIK